MKDYLKGIGRSLCKGENPKYIPVSRKSLEVSEAKLSLCNLIQENHTDMGFSYLETAFTDTM